MISNENTKRKKKQSDQDKMQKEDQTDSVITNLNQITRLPGTDDNLTNRKSKSNNNKETDQINSNTSNSDNSITASKRPKSIIFFFKEYYFKSVRRIDFILFNKRYCIKATTFTSMAAHTHRQNGATFVFCDWCYF